MPELRSTARSSAWLRLRVRHRAALFAATGIIVVAPTASAPAAFQDKCNSKQKSIDNWRRKDAQAYTVSARGEGYQWGGGCWNDNDRDEGAGDPPQQVGTRGEGGDCSGFVFKTWALRDDANTSTFRFHNRMQNIHGPYGSGVWKTTTNWNRPGSHSSTLDPMDTLADNYHIAMIYTGQRTKEGLYRYIEAKSESQGTDVWLRNYHSENGQEGIRYVRASRKNWTPDCHPQAC